jgi:hypothetical protein
MSGKFNQSDKEKENRMATESEQTKARRFDNHIGKALARMRKGQSDDEILIAMMTWSKVENAGRVIENARDAYNKELRKNGNGKKDASQLSLTETDQNRLRSSNAAPVFEAKAGKYLVKFQVVDVDHKDDQAPKIAELEKTIAGLRAEISELRAEVDAANQFKKALKEYTA